MTVLTVEGLLLDIRPARGVPIALEIDDAAAERPYLPQHAAHNVWRGGTASLFMCPLNVV